MHIDANIFTKLLANEIQYLERSLTVIRLNPSQGWLHALKSLKIVYHFKRMKDKIII